MNRRGFFAALVAAPLAAVAGLRNKGPVGFWGREIVKRCRGAHYETHIWDDPYVPTEEWDREKIIAYMQESGEACGESFSMSKGLVGCENILGRKGT